MSAGAKKAPLRPAYLILGDNEPKVEFALRRLRARITADSGTELNIDEFSAAHDGARDVVNAANTLAFLGGVRLVLVHRVEAWKKEDKEVIASYLRSPAPDACLALVGLKLPPTDLLRAAVTAVGDVLEYVAPRSQQMPDWAVHEAEPMGLNLALPEARLLVQRVGDNQHTILRELEKLAAYKGRGKVTAQDVDLLAARTLEADVFALLDALAGRRAADVFAAVEELYVAGEKPTGLFYRVLRHFELVARVAALREENLRPENQFVPFVQSELKLKPFHARKIAQQAGRLGTEGARRALAVLAESDARMKGERGLPAELEFELCLGKMLAT